MNVWCSLTTRQSPLKIKRIKNTVILNAALISQQIGAPYEDFKKAPINGLISYEVA